MKLRRFYSYQVAVMYCRKFSIDVGKIKSLPQNDYFCYHYGYKYIIYL